tara:strand:- start:3035 stop:4318 length:1284 start_codon:yes stop_codon:yes gene_type:complete
MASFIFIANQVCRSGGNLLSRLFDGNKKIATYPSEVGFKLNKNLLKNNDKIIGAPTFLPKFDKNIDPVDFFELEKDYQNFKYAENSYIHIGVRKNYLEKSYYEKKINTDFDFDKYFKNIRKYCNGASNNQELYYFKHKAYFHSWDNGIYWNDPNHIVTQDSNGLFLTNYDRFFSDFIGSIVFVPIRNCLGYVASEKIRIAKRYLGARRFAKPSPPNFIIKKFNEYDLKWLVNTWRVSLDKVKILQEKYRENVFVLPLENLTENTQKVMDDIFLKLNTTVEEINYEPTIGGKTWLGNSHMGGIKGIKNNPNNYIHEILRQDEIHYINKKINNIDNILKSKNESLVDLTSIEDKYFFDVSKQRSLSKDNDSWILYNSFYFRGYRKLKVKQQDIFLILFTLFFQIYSKIYNFFKVKLLKIFPRDFNVNNT